MVQPGLARVVPEPVSWLWRPAQRILPRIRLVGRSAAELADRCGAVLDHANSRDKFRNLLAFQDRGAITTTLAEIRNRADLLVVVGTDVVSRFPRFFERIAAPAGTLFGLKDADRRF